MRKILPWVIALLLIWPAIALAQDTEIDMALFYRVEKNLMCTDGCGMRLAVCDNATAQQMRQEIKEYLTAGQGEQEIYAAMIAKYGEEVMAAPPPSSPFNLTAWVMPFLLLLGGGLVIYVALDRWVFNHHSEATGQDVEDAVELAEYEQLVDAEVRKRF